MLTDRLSSGPSHMGDLNMIGALNRRTNIQEKGPESFAAVVERAQEKSSEPKPPVVNEQSRAPQKNPNGQNEAGSRTEKDLSVKRKETGAGEQAKSDRSNSSDDQNSEHEENFEPKGGKVKSDERVSAAKPKKNLSQRQKVMQEFMDSTESEFSIPPERMVEAMAKLNDKALLQAPEETASQVISDLKLPPGVADQVEARYVQMLAKLSDIENRRPEKMLQPTGEQLAMIQAAGGLAGLGAIASYKKGDNGEAKLVTVKDSRMLLNNSLGKLSEQFFRNGPELTQGSLGEEAAGKMDPSMASLEAGLAGDRFTQQGANGLELDAQKGPVDFNQVKPLPGLKEGQVKLADQGYQELSEKLAAVGLSASALNQSFKANPNLRSTQMEQLLQAKANGANLLAGGSNGYNLNLGSGIVAGAASAEAGDDFSSFSEGGGSSRDSLDMNSGKGAEFFIQKDNGPLLKSEFAAGMAGATPVARTAEQTQNIQQLMNQAQYVIKKGGGEAIVKLNPEGLGEVQLRVSVNEGKVSLQMNAETKEAKNLIESSLKDLQNSLSSHNLKVDHIKVDVGNQSSTENGSMHKQGGFNFDQGREQARQFLNNFQEENLANRSNFFEAPGLKAYNPHKGPDPLKPSAEAASRYVGEGRGTGLNLVA